MPENDRRSGVPRRAMVAPVLMLLAGMLTSVALWIVLNRDAAPTARQGHGPWSRAVARLLR